MQNKNTSTIELEKIRKYLAAANGQSVNNLVKAIVQEKGYQHLMFLRETQIELCLQTLHSFVSSDDEPSGKTIWALINSLELIQSLNIPEEYELLEILSK